MEAIAPRRTVDLALWTLVGSLFLAQYFAFVRSLLHIWRTDAEFSYGVLIPGIVAYLIWLRRERLQKLAKEVWPSGLAIVLVGCGLQVLASISGSLFFSGLALTTSLMGVTGFIWGRQLLRIIAIPLGFLVLMVPLPSYVLGQLIWRLQTIATTMSAKILDWTEVPVFQDGNILKLSNYILEVKQACSGSRSIFALAALALLLGFGLERKWWIRVLLLAAAPILAILANVIRIVGTGLIASRFGNIAADEMLHTVWGVLVFTIAVIGLFAFQRFLLWVTTE